MKYAMIRMDTDAINDWIWDDVAALIRKRNPELLVVCVAEYVTETDYLKDDIIDFVMEDWQ